MLQLPLLMHLTFEA